MTSDGALAIAVIGAPGGHDSARVRALADAGRAGSPELVLVENLANHEPDAAVVLGPDPDGGAERLLRAGVPVVAVGDFTRSPTIRLPADVGADVIAAVARGLGGHHRKMISEIGAAEQCRLHAARQLDELHEEMLLAAGIQQEFIPRTSPPMKGLEFGVVLRPSSFVSGDIYRVERLDERKVALLVADAVGHGLSAGLLTMYLCSRFMHAVHGGTHCPGAILHGMNNSLVACEGRPKLATAVCAVIDEFTGEVMIASAGHPPPVLVSERGGVLLPPEGTLLGVWEDSQYEPKSVLLAPGDTIVMYTDGLDVLCPNHAAGSAAGGLTQWLASAFQWGRPLDRAIAAAEAHLDGGPGSLRYPDDITVAAARFTGRAAA